MNVGDSRAIIGSKNPNSINNKFWISTVLTRDHKP